MVMMNTTKANEENNREIATFVIRQVMRDNALATFSAVESVTLQSQVIDRLKARGWSLAEVKRAYKAACGGLLEVR